MPTNDNVPAPIDLPLSARDAHGAAALLLVESLIHGLCEKSLLTARDAVDIVDRAISVQSERAELAGHEAPVMWRSHALLSSIAASLRHDITPAPATPRAVT